MSVLWLRTAAALYSCGLLYALVYLFRKSTRFFRPALIAFGAGAVFHLVSLVELWADSGHLPLNNFYEAISLCAFLIAVLFLLAYSFYQIAIFSVCLFPLVFFMTVIGATEFPVAKWLKRKSVPLSASRLPPLGTLDRIISQTMNTGFVFITIGTVSGVVWAFIENGTGWIGDPKIDFFLFTWAFYLAMIFLRVSAGWRGRRIAWLAVSVLGCSLITWATHVTLRSFWSR
jgi:ABC-type transport system involved in cytochrome c biogenesis permease subunit